MAVGLSIGVVLNLFWTTLWFAINPTDENHMIALKITLMFFPTVVGMMDIDNQWGVDAFALIGMNAVLYAFLGYLIKLGIYKHKFFLIVMFLLVVELWRRVWILH